MQFSLSKMFVAMLMLGIAFAGMTFCSRWWAHGILIFSALLYLFMAIRAIASQGLIRATSLAFALAGGGYLLLNAFGIFSPMRDMLLTNQALIAVGKVWYHPRPMVIATWTTSNGLTPQYQGYADELNNSVPKDAKNLSVHPLERYDWPDEFGNGDHTVFHPAIPEHAFVLIGHCALSWLFAVLASCLASWIYIRQEKLQRT
jgi:hypothetical protein